MFNIKNNNIGANVSLAYRLSSKLGLNLGYSLKNDASSYINTNFVRTETFRFQSTYQLSRRLAVNASLINAHDRYEGGVPVPLQIRDNRQKSVSVGGSMKVGRKINVSLQGTHIERNADIRIYDFKSDNVTLSLTAQF